MVHAGIFHTPVFRPEIDNLAGEPGIYYRAQAAPASHLIAKRLFDCIGAALLLGLSAPVLAIIGASIKLTSAGPVFFRQRRCGLNGHPFDMLKFRSMVCDAEARKAGLAARNEMKGPVFKVHDDPRVTRLGVFLRRHGLDELPQLWNVLRGEMSLVGPRPERPEFVAWQEAYAELGAVLETIEYLHGSGVWVELTTLLIPGHNDGREQIEQPIDPKMLRPRGPRAGRGPRPSATKTH